MTDQPRRLRLLRVAIVLALVFNLMALLVLPLMVRKRSLVTKERVKQFGIACGACLVVLAPWMIRNVATFEEFRRSDTSHQWRRAAPFQPQG